MKDDFSGDEELLNLLLPNSPVSILLGKVEFLPESAGTGEDLVPVNVHSLEVALRLGVVGRPSVEHPQVVERYDLTWAEYKQDSHRTCQREITGQELERGCHIPTIETQKFYK